MMSNQMSRLQEQLVDLYLSVKIRSNDEVRVTFPYGYITDRQLQ
jgi:hypothetical protein